MLILEIFLVDHDSIKFRLENHFTVAWETAYQKILYHGFLRMFDLCSALKNFSKVATKQLNYKYSNTPVYLDICRTPV